jgi:hypothetical protein
LDLGEERCTLMNADRAREKLLSPSLGRNEKIPAIQQAMASVILSFRLEKQV